MKYAAGDIVELNMPQNEILHKTTWTVIGPWNNDNSTRKYICEIASQHSRVFAEGDRRVWVEENMKAFAFKSRA